MLLLPPQPHSNRKILLEWVCFKQIKKVYPAPAEFNINFKIIPKLKMLIKI